MVVRSLKFYKSDLIASPNVHNNRRKCIPLHVGAFEVQYAEGTCRVHVIATSDHWWPDLLLNLGQS